MFFSLTRELDVEAGYAVSALFSLFFSPYLFFELNNQVCERTLSCWRLSLPGVYEDSLLGWATTHCAECDKQLNVLAFPPVTGGCSEGLDAFRFFFKQSYYNKHVFISEEELYFFNACTVYICTAHSTNTKPHRLRIDFEKHICT